MLSQFVAYQMHSLLMLTKVLHLIIVHIGCYEEKNVHKGDICALHIAYYCVPITNYIKDLMFGIQSKCPNQ